MYCGCQGMRPELDEVNLQKIAEAVGVSAVRFNIIRVSPEKGFTFKWEDALSFEGNSTPFIMYSHTRACSIAKKISEKPSLSNLPPQPENAAIDLMRTLAWFDERLSRSVQESKPHYSLVISLNWHLRTMVFIEIAPSCEMEMSMHSISI